MIVIPYSREKKEEWDAFVEEAKNATFLFKRDFMDYHSDRFMDCSVMVYDKTQLVAMLPANWEQETLTVWSHQGLTYGGLIMSDVATTLVIMQAMEHIVEYYAEELGAKTLIYKVKPYIYSLQPSEEDIYAVTRLRGRLKWCMVSTTVDTRHLLRMRTLRQRGVQKAQRYGCYIERVGESDVNALAEYWKILKETLKKHGVTPVHSVAEMMLLMKRFRKEIKLFVARRDGTMLGGIWMFETKRVAHAQYIAASDEGRRCGVLDMLFQYLITEHSNGGKEYFDFGVSVEEHGYVLNEGLIFQKEGFGGRAICYNTYEIDITDTARNVTDYFNLERQNRNYQPVLNEEIGKTVGSGWYLRGERNKQFAKEWARVCGRRYCVNVGNGLDALTLTLAAYKKMKHWDDKGEVIVPANTFVATVLAVIRAGLTPVLCDPDPDNALITAENAATFVNGHTVALIPVHLYGNRCDLNALQALSEMHGLTLIDDCAQAHGTISQDDDIKADANCWSFYPGKNLGALGDAGAVTTDDAELATMIEEMANYGQRKKYVCSHVGCNSRMDEIQATALSVKLKYLAGENQRRREIAHRYFSEINNPFVHTLNLTDEAKRNGVYHIFPVFCKGRDELGKWLNSRGIETLSHYPIPPHRQEALREYFKDKTYPVAERMADEELSLPIAPYMTDSEVEQVIKAINEFSL